MFFIEMLASSLMPLSVLILVISIISLLIKFITDTGLSYKSHFVAMGTSVGIFAFSILALVAINVASDGMETDHETNVEFVTTENSSKNQIPSTNEVQEKDESFENQTLITESYAIKITDHEIIPPGEENNYNDEPIIIFLFETTVSEDSTNDSITPSSAWLSSFEVIQDNNDDFINDLELTILYDKDDSSDKKIKPGGTISGSMSYKLTDNETPVTIIALENIVNGKEIGRHDYQVE